MIEALKERRLMKKLAAINRETIPERAMFARGTGARGVFQPYMSLSDYTAADFLSDPEKETPVFVRFSKALAQNGETGRDLRGFSVRFYTEEGNYDLLAGSMPVFYTSDPKKIPKLIAALKRDKKSNLSRPEQFWSFMAANPEAFPMVLHLYGDGGTIKSYRHMPGYSVHTYRWINRRGDGFLVRYSWAPIAGIKSITRQESEFLAGFDEDAVSRDLYEHLEEGKAAEYELVVQIVPEQRQHDFPFLLTDVTKIWSDEQVPHIRIGKMVLTDTVTDYLNEVEKAAFSPGNLVRGIAFSDDPLLPVMAFAMEDSQRHRLGAGYEQLPVNRCRIAGTGEDADWDDWDEERGEGPAAIKKKRLPAVDHYGAAQTFYQGLDEEARRRLEDNLTEDLMFVRDDLQKELIRHFLQVDQELGKRIAKGLTF